MGLGEGNNLGMELVGSDVVYGKRQPWWEGLWRGALYTSLMLTRRPGVGWGLAWLYLLCCLRARGVGTGCANIHKDKVTLLDRQPGSREKQRC